MKRLLTFICGAVISLSVFVPALSVAAQEQPEEQPQAIEIKNTYYRGKVLEIFADATLTIGGMNQPYQDVKIEIIEGPDRGHTFEYEYQLPVNHTDRQKLKKGEQVVVVKVVHDEGVDYYVSEKYRLPSVMWIIIGFFLLAICFGGWKGFSSALGLAFSLFVIVAFMIPRIVAGWSPVWVSLASGVAIMLVSLYLAHGFVKRTHIALAGTAITLVMSAILSIIVVHVVRIFGMGSEESLSLLQGQLQNINLEGLYLGGIIIGTLGVLDDITTAQSAVVDELHRANPSLPISELYKRGISVGREHIASLVNTLALAYVGASLPILLIFTKTDFPMWVIFNSEFLVEEIVRTLVGSATLILAVPLTTWIAATVLSRDRHPQPLTDADGHSHHGHRH